MKMNRYIIVFESNKQRNKIIGVIERQPKWARLSTNAYIVITENDILSLRDNLKLVVEREDRIFISKITTPAAWANLEEEVSDWIKINLKNDD